MREETKSHVKDSVLDYKISRIGECVVISTSIPGEKVWESIKSEHVVYFYEKLK